MSREVERAPDAAPTSESGPSEPPGLPRLTRVGAYAVVVEDGRLLLARLSSDRVRWTLPGGGVEFGEDPSDGARREVREETGLDVVLDRLLGVYSVHVPRFSPPDLPTVDLHGISLVWRAHAVGGDLRPEVGGSTDRVEWVPLGEVAARPTLGLVDVALAWL